MFFSSQFTLVYSSTRVSFVCNGVRVQGEGTCAVFRSTPRGKFGTAYSFVDDCPLKVKKQENKRKEKIYKIIIEYLKNIEISTPIPHRHTDRVYIG